MKKRFGLLLGCLSLVHCWGNFTQPPDGGTDDPSIGLRQGNWDVIFGAYNGASADYQSATAKVTGNTLDVTVINREEGGTYFNGGPSPCTISQSRLAISLRFANRQMDGDVTQIKQITGAGCANSGVVVTRVSSKLKAILTAGTGTGPMAPRGSWLLTTVGQTEQGRLEVTDTTFRVEYQRSNRTIVVTGTQASDVISGRTDNGIEFAARAQ